MANEPKDSDGSRFAVSDDDIKFLTADGSVMSPEQVRTVQGRTGHDPEHEAEVISDHADRKRAREDL